MFTSYRHIYSDLFKKSLFIVVFFLITPLTLLVSVFCLKVISSSKSFEPEVLSEVAKYDNVRVYSPSNPSSGVSSDVALKDARPEILRKYLRTNNSPLLKYVDILISTSDEYDLDYRLLVAIAQKESGLCRVIPENSHNCWGWGIHSKGTLKFDSYEQSIQTVARGLKKEYIDKGYVTVEEIMSKWVPHSPEGVWAKDVQSFMDDLS